MYSSNSVRFHGYPGPQWAAAPQGEPEGGLHHRPAGQGGGLRGPPGPG